MAKLVIQNQGMTGRACELHTDRTTIGRVEDNTFQSADASVSSHHCEVHLRGSDIFIRDLNSTNGSFINGNKIEESILKRAAQKGHVTFNPIDLRQFTTDRHQSTDDRPFGGGPGMVMKPEPLFKAVESVRTPVARVIRSSWLPGTAPSIRFSFANACS